jgi:hypothetical protein
MWLLDYLFCSLNSSTLQLLLDVIIDAERIGTAGARRSEKANVCAIAGCGIRKKIDRN